MRRLTGILLALSMLQLTALDLRAVCDRHERTMAAGDASGMAMDHAAHAAHHGAVPTPQRAPSPDDDTRPQPERCCMLAGACTGSAFANVVSATTLTWFDAGLGVSRVAGRPSSRAFSPEPPPPRA